MDEHDPLQPAFEALNRAFAEARDLRQSIPVDATRGDQLGCLIARLEEVRHELCLVARVVAEQGTRLRETTALAIGGTARRF